MRSLLGNELIKGDRRIIVKILILITMWLCVLGIVLDQAGAKTLVDCQAGQVQATTRTNLGLEYKIDGLIFLTGPDITYNDQRSMAWDHVVQGLRAHRNPDFCKEQLKELFEVINKKEDVMEATVKRILKSGEEWKRVLKDAQEIQQKLMEESRVRSISPTEEGDRMFFTRKPEAPSADDPIAQSLDDLKKRLDELNRIDRR